MVSARSILRRFRENRRLPVFVAVGLTAVDVEPVTGGPQPLQGILADHFFQRGDTHLGDHLDILPLVTGRGVPDQLADPEVEIEIVSSSDREFRHDRNSGFEMEQRRCHVDPGRMAEKDALDAFIPRRVLVDQHGDVFSLIDGAQHGTDSFGFVDQLVHLPGAVGEDHSADERIAEGTHHREHRNARLFGERLSGDLPVAEMGGDDDDLMVLMVGGSGIIDGFLIAGNGDFTRDRER